MIIDINLGECRTGIEVLRALKELPEYEGVPTIAATAYAMAGDGERF